MSEQKRGKKRSKAYYRKCAAGSKKARTSQSISPGMKGFLITCNSHEKETVSEMYNLLNEYADEMYGPEFEKKQGSDEEGEESSEEDDMEKAMAKETSAIKQANSKERRFQNTMTKTKNVIFIRTTCEDPDRLIHEIFRDGLEKQVKKTRFAQRILPVNVICKTDVKLMETGLTEVLKPHFETDFGVGIKYTAQCKIRNNNSVSRTVILSSLNKIIKEMNPQHTLCHDEPDLVIIVEVVMKVCCLSVVKDFFKFRRYNYEQIFNTNEELEEIETELKENETDARTDEIGTRTSEVDASNAVDEVGNIGKEIEGDEGDVTDSKGETEITNDETENADNKVDSETNVIDNDIENRNNTAEVTTDPTDVADNKIEVVNTETDKTEMDAQN